MFKKYLKKGLPEVIISSYRMVRYSLREVVSFLFDVNLGGTSIGQRFQIIYRFWLISGKVDCPHTQAQMLAFTRAVLSMPAEQEGVIVEAGSYKGGSTAKFSLAAEIANREIIVFDSFEGIPEQQQSEDILTGEEFSFQQGDYAGCLEEVKNNVKKFGSIEVCDFRKGLFKDTMPGFSGPVVAIYLDVDLASSTKTCLKQLWPQLVNGGILFSQDGHLSKVVEVLDDDEFWEREVGFPKPTFKGLRERKLVRAKKQE